MTHFSPHSFGTLDDLVARGNQYLLGTWDDLLALLALGLLLLAVDAGSGAPSPLAVVAGIGLGRFR